MGKHTSNLPDLSMRQAMQMYIISGRGKIDTVADCPAAAFLHQVKQAIETVPGKKRAVLVRELLELDYESPKEREVSRYYAITRLQESGAVQFIYESYVDDRDSRTKANSLSL